MQNAPRHHAADLKADNDRFAPVRGIAAELSITPARPAPAWLLHHDEHAVPVSGSRTPARIEENLAAGRVELSQDVPDRLTAILGATQVEGGTLL
ncbi:aldo/keto reductase [Streptomyces sp. NPDC096176]|uniref:aldo/keto reductase n=1 Tax=Streptomyces sp. NPDC096176 TaxID=3366079 RepID=UPI003803510D